MSEPYALASGGLAANAELQDPRLAPTAHDTACEQFQNSFFEQPNK